jgi:hypothetical protein
MALLMDSGADTSTATTASSSSSNSNTNSSTSDASKSSSSNGQADVITTSQGLEVSCYYNSCAYCGYSMLEGCHTANSATLAEVVPDCYPCKSECVVNLSSYAAIALCLIATIECAHCTYVESWRVYVQQAMNRHLAALGRFGDTAFLTPMYGVGEVTLYNNTQ